MRKIISFVLVLAMCLCLFGCGASQTPGTTPATVEATQPAAVSYEDVVILYTNDVHTYIDNPLSYAVIAGLKAELVSLQQKYNDPIESVLTEKSR